MFSGLLMSMAALIVAVATSVIKIKYPTDKNEHNQDMGIHSRRRVTDQKLYVDSMSFVTDSATIEDNDRQKEVRNSYRNDKSSKLDSTTIADNYVRRELTNTTRHEYSKLIYDSATVANNHGRREVTTTIADHERGVTYPNSATSADQQNVTDSNTFSDSHRRREITNSTRNEHNLKFSSATSASYYRGVIIADSSTIAENYRRKKVTYSTSNDENVTFDSATIANVTNTDTSTVADNLGRREVTSSESTTIANDQRGVTNSDSVTIANHRSIADYRRVETEAQREDMSSPTLKEGETYDPDMTLPADFMLPTQRDVPVDPRFVRTKSNDPALVTSGIRFPLIPRLDEDNREPCDLVAYFCPKSYKTGKVCGRASNFIYRTFETYCELDYINCKERTNVWKIIYMGECIPKPKPEEWVKHQPPLMYEYHDDYFLDDIFVIDETFHEDIMEKLEPIHTPVSRTN